MKNQVIIKAYFYTPTTVWWVWGPGGWVDEEEGTREINAYGKKLIN